MAQMLLELVHSKQCGLRSNARANAAVIRGEEPMIKVVLLRHGESTWNVENRFTGWTDVDLSLIGILEARRAGRLLNDNGYTFDTAYASVLKRSIRTLWLVTEEMDLHWLPVIKDWRLNERHYGALQGLNKSEITEHYGAEQVHLWRRGFATRPPAMSFNDPRLPYHDPRYVGIPTRRLPSTESLEDTMKRSIHVGTSSSFRACRRASGHLSWRITIRCAH